MAIVEGISFGHCSGLVRWKRKQGGLCLFLLSEHRCLVRTFGRSPSFCPLGTMKVSAFCQGELKAEDPGVCGRCCIGQTGTALSVCSSMKVRDGELGWMKQGSCPKCLVLGSGTG